MEFYSSPDCTASVPDLRRARRALAAIIQGREALADGDCFFAEAALENAEAELASFLAGAV